MECEWGRDILNYGDFEDHDVDGEYSEGSVWAQSPVRFVENSVVHSGTGALVLLRRGSNRSTVSSWLRNKVTFALKNAPEPPERKDLTLTGYTKADNAGQARILVRWYDRDSSDTISTQVVLAKEPGTCDWAPFSVDLDTPPGAGSVRLFFQLDPPDAGEGRFFVDDVQLVQWEGRHADASGGVELKTPNNWSWIRFRSLDAMPVTFDVTLTHRSYSLNYRS